ncbi:MAG: hypothetical protein ACRED3_18185 [Bradyrhizobium sp.]
MKHQSLDELKVKADVVPLEPGRPAMSRRERIERWAAVLEQHQDPLTPLLRIETYSREARRSLRGDRSPIAVAFSDPILRADGLAGDTLGDAQSYFQLSSGKAHRLLCDCHYRGTMTGSKVAARLLSVAKGGIFQRLWNWSRSL